VVGTAQRALAAVASDRSSHRPVRKVATSAGRITPSATSARGSIAPVARTRSKSRAVGVTEPVRTNQTGVTMINGSDEPPGEPCDGTVCAIRELELMLDAGLTPLQTLQAATVNAARLCRIEREVGAVEPGLAADLIAVDGDPTQDASAMRGVRLVMQAGRVVRWSG